MRGWLREPLLHFLLIGLVLFGIYGWLGRAADDPGGEIVVTRERVANLAADFARLWHRPPTSQELDGQIEGWIREEVLYREGLALGLDREDPIVRRRIAQKMGFIAETREPREPTEAELQAWLDTHPASYRIEPIFTFRQFYFDPARRGPGLDSDVTAALAVLARGGTVESDATMLPEALSGASALEVRRTFGPDFERALSGLPSGSWQGPVRSGFGLHLVRLDALTPGRTPQLAEVRRAVRRDVTAARAREANDAAYRALRARHEVTEEPGARRGVVVLDSIPAQP